MFKVYKRYYQFLLRYKSRFIIYIFAVIISSVVYSIQPYFYKLFINGIPSGNIRNLTTILLFYILVRVLEVIFDNLNYFCGDTVIIPAARDARLAIFKKVQDLDFAYHTSKSTGSLISVFRRGDGAFFEINDIIHGHTLSIAINFLIILLFFSRINWQVTLVMFLSFAVNAFLAKFLIKNNIKARVNFNKEEDNITATLVDNLINYETVKLFAKEDWEYKRLEKQFIPWKKSLWKFADTFRLIDITVGTLGNLGLFFVLLIGLKKLANFELTAGDYIMIIGFISSFYPRLFEFIYQLRRLAKHYVDIQKYFEILEKDNLIKDPKKPVRKKQVKGLIELKNLDFSYPEGKKDAIKNINLTINPGESIAFVGHSGSGKTTLIKLLMRFFDPDKGQISIDNINIKNFTKSQLRSFMGTVPQEPILFNNTIAYNIGYGADSASLLEIKEAAKLANLDEFIESLPKKYQTNVGERGVKLSGGQKQRLAIARMIISKPNIVIFDEATSQLDSDSEKKIQDAFWKATKNKTTLIIAHRLSTIVRADKIVVLKNGKIQEIGTHQELLDDPQTLYSYFWSLQSQS